jgi:hypothetical protein
LTREKNQKGFDSYLGMEIQKEMWPRKVVRIWGFCTILGQAKEKGIGASRY